MSLPPHFAVEGVAEQLVFGSWNAAWCILVAAAVVVDILGIFEIVEVVAVDILDHKNGFLHHYRS